MPHYKDSNNELHFLDSSEFEYLLPIGCVKITQVEADAIIAAEEAAKPGFIPTITMRQVRLALFNIGLLDEIEAAITTPENKIWWEYSTTVERSHPLVILVLTALGKTEVEIDLMFISAAQL